EAVASPSPARTVTLAQCTCSSTLTTATGTTGADGVATFTVKSTKAETVVYTATDSTDSTAIIQTAQVIFDPGAATHLDVVPQAATQTAGSSFNVTVTARDAHDNVATGYTGPVHFTAT